MFVVSVFRYSFTKAFSLIDLFSFENVLYNFVGGILFSMQNLLRSPKSFFVHFVRSVLYEKLWYADDFEGVVSSCMLSSVILLFIFWLE